MKNEEKKTVEQEGIKHASIWQTFIKNKLALVGLILILFWAVLAIGASVFSPYDPLELNMADKLSAPGIAERTGNFHLCGTDQFGRDIFSRIIYGARITVWSGVISVGIALSIGVVLGGIAGFYGGRIGNVIMRCMDAMMAFPSLVLAIVIASTMGRGIVSAMIAVGIVSIPDYARLMFAQTSAIKEVPYIEAGRAIGLSNKELIFKHILPNCLSQLMVKATLGLGFAILTVSSLSFLGMGVEPPTPEWGQMISEGRQYITSGEWWLTTFPGLAIVTSILGFNLVGDGIRDILDPRNRTGA